MRSDEAMMLFRYDIFTTCSFEKGKPVMFIYFSYQFGYSRE